MAGGGLRAGECRQSGLLLAVELGCHGGPSPGRALQQRERAAFDGLLAPRLQAPGGNAVRFGDVLVGPGWSVRPLVALEQRLRPLQLPPCNPPLANDTLEFGPLFGR